MKRKPILFAVALLLVVGAALWGVNYRLDHPPLTQADKEFRAMVAGADSVEIVQYTPKPTTANGSVKHPSLNLTQTHELIEIIRLLKWESDQSPVSGTESFTTLVFFRDGKPLRKCDLYLNQSSSQLLVEIKSGQFIMQGSSGGMNRRMQMSFPINPRFNKRLNRLLDAYLPQRIRP